MSRQPQDGPLSRRVASAQILTPVRPDVSDAFLSSAVNESRGVKLQAQSRAATVDIMPNRRLVGSPTGRASSE